MPKIRPLRLHKDKYGNYFVYKDGHKRYLKNLKEKVTQKNIQSNKNVVKIYLNNPKYHKEFKGKRRRVNGRKRKLVLSKPITTGFSTSTVVNNNNNSIPPFYEYKNPQQFENLFSKLDKLKTEIIDANEKRFVPIISKPEIPVKEEARVKVPDIPLAPLPVRAKKPKKGMKVEPYVEERVPLPDIPQAPLPVRRKKPAPQEEMDVEPVTTIMNVPQPAPAPVFDARENARALSRELARIRTPNPLGRLRRDELSRRFQAIAERPKILKKDLEEMFTEHIPETIRTFPKSILGSNLQLLTDVPPKSKRTREHFDNMSSQLNQIVKYEGKTMPKLSSIPESEPKFTEEPKAKKAKVTFEEPKGGDYPAFTHSTPQSVPEFNAPPSGDEPSNTASKKKKEKSARRMELEARRRKVIERKNEETVGFEDRIKEKERLDKIREETAREAKKALEARARQKMEARRSESKSENYKRESKEPEVVRPSVPIPSVDEINSSKTADPENEFAPNKQPKTSDLPLGGEPMDTENQEGGGKYNDFDDGLYEDEIQKIMLDRDRVFVPVASSDEISKLAKFVNRKTKEFSFVVNTDVSSGEGKHWVAYHISIPRGEICYYNSFGGEPPKLALKQIKKIVDKINPDIYLKLKYSLVKEQSATSANCGFFVIRFLERVLNHGDSFKKATKFDDSKRQEKAIERFKNYL